MIAAAYRAQADALVIEAEAKRKLADEYDAAQARGEIKKAGNPNSSKKEELPGVRDLDLTDKDIHVARIIRDAEQAAPGLIERTVNDALAAGQAPTKAKLTRAALANARTAAEVLEARDMAAVAYDMAKRAARLARAKQAHDDLIAAAYRAQADALVIEAEAKRKLADEYDAAQARGEVAKAGYTGHQNDVPNENVTPSASDLGLSRKAIHSARIIRDAEKAAPGQGSDSIVYELREAIVRDILALAEARGLSLC